MRFFLAPRLHTMGIFKTHILLWASQITLCNGLKAWSLSFLGLLYVKLTTVNVLMLFPVKEINMCSGEVGNTAQQIGIHIPLFMGFCLLKIVTYCLLGVLISFKAFLLLKNPPKSLMTLSDILTHCLGRSNCPIHKRVGKLFSILGIFKPEF